MSQHVNTQLSKPVCHCVILIDTGTIKRDRELYVVIKIMTGPSTWSLIIFKAKEKFVTCVPASHDFPSWTTK